MDLFGELQPQSRWEFELLARRMGYRLVAGIDEAGRGPLAGPVVAAAVILPDGEDFSGVDDSKKLSASARERLYDLIYEKALAIGVGISDHQVIDRINILQATLSAMREAVGSLCRPADYLLIDGTSGIPVSIPQRTIKKGDSASISIAAASIIAKVTRDRMMTAYEDVYPGYGFREHKGYACATHLAAIAGLGPSPIHRKTFRGVREHVQEEE
ncbi:ribonuclease HII [Geobacter sp. DSM 9736]|uniref:ribonuclease HII n=1 Tax=Geobacter sp. DSM 9736 TaxID=1277350 RepID=UPI000B5072EF|nr:ribonuclease HII [Geobacter sp. DSM 9736]SNB46362.1 RNase HII [Geobacter sp. DSM 9736]